MPINEGSTLFPSDTVIRSARDADLPAITGIYAYHVRYGLATFETEPPTQDEMSRRHSELTSKGFPYLVVVRDREVLGYAYVSPYRARPAYRFVVENSIYLDPAFAGKGIGRVLLDALIRASESRGFRQMIAIIGDSANHASIKVHERCGFTLVGTFRSVGFKHGRWVDTVLMQRPLGSGDKTLPQ